MKFLSVILTALAAHQTNAAGLIGYSGDHCDGDTGSYITANQGQYKCTKFSSRHSIYIDNNCPTYYAIEYYEDLDCRGHRTDVTSNGGQCLNVNTGGWVASIGWKCV